MHPRKGERVKQSAIIASIVGAALIGIFFALSYFSLGRGGEQRIAQAFEAGTLTDRDYVYGNTLIGVHQFNDCLILGMAINQRQPTDKLTISPSIPFPNLSEICEQLHFGQTNSDKFYHNYIHGHTVLIRYLLPYFPISSIRELYRTGLTISLFFVVVFSMRRILKGDHEGAIFLIVAFVFLRFFGLEIFGQSLSHAPSDTIIVLYLLALSVKRWPTSPLLVVSSAFGALTMIFEFMTGGLPIGLGMVVGLTWFALVDRSVANVMHCVAAYCIAVAVCILAKVGAISFVFGVESLRPVADMLLVRVDGKIPEFIGNRSYFSAIFSNMGALVPGDPLMALLMVLTAIGGGAWALIRDPRVETKLLSASIIPIFGWLAVFRQHTTIHAWYIDRMFTWVIACGFLLVFVTLQNMPFASMESKRRITS